MVTPRSTVITRIMTQDKEKNAALENHLQHVLRTLQGDSLRETINEEISALFEWFDEVRLKDFINPQQAWEHLQRILLEPPISDETLAFLTECAKRIHSYLRRNETRLEGILPKDQYDELVENLIELEDLKNEIINQAVSSSIFSMMITNVLYSGIKGFIVSENILVKNIPGASSLLRVGMELMNMTTLGLLGSVDDKMRRFIENNIQAILKDSERFLVEALDERLLTELGNELWERVSEYNSHNATEYIDANHIESIAPIVRDLWLHLRKSPIFSEVCNTSIEYFFERNGKKRIRIFLEEIGITKDGVLTELTQIAVPFLEKDVVQRYLEKRTRARLGAYYLSEGKKEPGRKLAIRKRRSKSSSATDAVLQVIRGNKRGVTVALIKQKTGFSDSKIRGIIYRLKKQDKIKRKVRGVYIANIK